MKKLASEKNVILSDEKIKQIMAGYKANYNRRINSTNSDSIKKALILAKDNFLLKKREQLLEHNRIIAGSSKKTIFSILKKFFSR